MCLTIAHLDLGAADVLLDPAEGLLVLRPTLTPAERLEAARRALDAAGVEQVGDGVTCRCGEPLRVPACRDNPATGRRPARGLAATAVVAVAATVVAFEPSSAEAEEPFDMPSWQAVVDELGLECKYASDRAGVCTSPTLGRVHVRVDPNPPFADAEYALVGPADSAYLWRFGSTAERDRFVDRYPRDAVPVAELGALHR